MNNEFHGYSLFNDVEDAVLRAFNRGRVVANMFEQHMDKTTRKINRRGAALVFGYFAQIPEDERKEAHHFLNQQLAKDGYVAASTN